MKGCETAFVCVCGGDAVGYDGQCSASNWVHKPVTAAGVILPSACVSRVCVEVYRGRLWTRRGVDVGA
jgi:hypothetical protein